MRISELLGLPVAGRDGKMMGSVDDIRLRFHQPGRGVPARLELTEIVVGRGDLRSRLAHRWGYAQGRARGPAVVRKALRRSAHTARVVPAERVADWGSRPLRIDLDHDELEQFEPEAKR